MIRIPETSDFENDIGTQADWAEVSCMFGTYHSISRSEVLKALELADLESDTMSEEIWREIDWRHSMMPNAHPIDVSKEELTRMGAWTDFSAYSFLLLLSWQSTQKVGSKGNPWKRPSKLFEQLVTATFERRWQHAINTGSPRVNPVPTSFDKCLKYVCDRTHEDQISAKSHIHYSKDCGLDVIAWDPFDDRPSQVVLLVQCATGSNWRSKVHDIELERWRYLIRFASIPTRAFAFPYALHKEDDWWDLSASGGLLLDRLRIIGSVLPAPDLAVELAKWSKERIESLSWEQ